MADGTYVVSPAIERRADSLWIGSRYASRTRPVVVRAETRGGVTFDGGGADALRRHQLRGGCPPPDLGRVRVRQRDPDLDRGGGVRRLQRWLRRLHHITMRSLRFAASIRGSIPQDHDIYISATTHGTGGPHDLLFEDIQADGSGGIMSAFNFGHDWGDNAWNVTVRRLTAVNFDTAIVVWGEGVLDHLLFEDITVTNSGRFAVRYENGSDSRIVFRKRGQQRLGQPGSTAHGTPVPGVTLSNCSFN